MVLNTSSVKYAVKDKPIVVLHFYIKRFKLTSIVYSSAKECTLDLHVYTSIYIAFSLFS